MRKVIYSIGILALAALSFASCQKQPVPENESGKMVTVTFVAEAPATKSAAVEGESSVSYNWTDEDVANMKLFTVDGTSLTEVLNPTVTKVSDTELTITATVASGSTVRAIMANSFTNSKNPRLSGTQSPQTDSFDPTADILISEDETINSDLQNAKMLFNRKVVVNKMSLHGLKLGEKIKRIIVTSDNHLTGYYDGESIHGENRTITLSYSDVPVTESSSLVANKGVFPVYFVAAANEAHTLSIRVETDQNVYEKTLGQAISLKLGQFTRFNVGLPTGTPISDSVDYTLVTSASSLPAVGKVGDIIIVNGTNAMAAQNANNRAVATVPAAVNNVISLDNSSTAHIFSLYHTEDGYLIYDKDESGYLYAAGTKDSGTNYLKSKDTVDASCYWSITYSNGVVSVVSATNTHTPYMRYNQSNSLFSCYHTESQQAISFYLNTASVIDIPSDNRQEVSLSFSPANPEPISLGDSFTEPTLTVSPVDATSAIIFSVSSEPANCATIDESGELTINSAGTITVTASIPADNANYKPASASYTLTVNSTFSSIAELYALDCSSTTGKEYSGTLSNAVVSYVPDTKNAIIKDATGSILFFKDGHGLSQGQTFSGETTVMVKTYSGLIELTAFSGEFTGSQSVIDPQNATLADIVGHYSDWQSAFVSVEDLEVTQKSGKNISVKDGENTYIVYDNTENANVAVGDIITAVGTITKYNTTEELKVWDASNIIKTGSVTPDSYTITVNQPASGGTISASETSAIAGTTINLTASPADGYEFSAWEVKDASNKAVSVKNNSFTMPASNVIVTALFNPIVSGTTVVIDSGSFTGDASSISFTSSDGITITQLKGDGNSIGTNYKTISTLRVYRANQLKFTGKTFTKIVITYTGTYSGADWSVIDGGGSISINTNEKTVTWTNADGSSSVIIQNSTSSGTNTQLRTSKFEFTYN